MRSGCLHRANRDGLPWRSRLSRRVSELLSAGAVALLAGCASGHAPSSSVEAGYVGRPVALECAPFARAVAEVRLTGEAGDWWQEAAGRYPRVSRPEVGALLTFRRTSRLPEGHVAVVSRLVSAREILVTHANWTPRRVAADVPVVDVSPGNDWTLVRVWWPPLGQLGTALYPTWGFILPARPPSHDQQMLAMRRVIRLAGE
jgi:hypothetical protein